MAASAAAKRGAFILFEGVDRCGKTTQARKLADALNAAGQPAVFMRFPGWRVSVSGRTLAPGGRAVAAWI